MKWLYLIDALLILLIVGSVVFGYVTGNATLNKHQIVFTAEAKLFNEIAILLSKLDEASIKQEKNNLAILDLYTLQQATLKLHTEKADKLLEELHHIAEEATAMEAASKIGTPSNILGIPGEVNTPTPTHRRARKVNMVVPILIPTPTPTPIPTPTPKPTSTPLIMNEGNSLYNSSLTQPYKH